jgi:tetratricopeptide (TPR) repeat protein
MMRAARGKTGTAIQFQRRELAAVPVLLLGIALAANAFTAPHDPWLRIQSANFELFTTAREHSGRDLVQHFEMVRSFFLQAFGSEAAGAKPVSIIVFRNRKEFAPYTPNQAASAFFHPGAAHDFIVMIDDSTGQYQVANHEYTHLLAGQTSETLPVWLNEGMAEMYETLEREGPLMVVGRAAPGRAQALISEKWIGLDVLLSATNDSPLYNEKDRAGMFYAESWALVHMLNLGNGYRTGLHAMLDALKTEDAAAAFHSAYGKSVAEVQQDLQAYIRSPHGNGVGIRVELPKSAEAPEVQTGAGMAARLALAELLSAYPGKVSQARAAYEKLGAEYPERCEVQSAWARFLFRERRNDEALEHFARAAELGSTDPLTFVDYGRALGVAGREQDSLAAFQKAVKLDPARKETHFDLGLAQVRAGAWREAVAELQLAVPVTRQQASRYFYNMAYAEYRMGDAVKARELIAQGGGFTHIPEETAALERLSQAVGPPMVEGVLETIECQGKVARLHVRVNDFPKVFLAPDLTEFAGLECGSQPAAQVRIEYRALPAGASGADGIVSTLEIK